MVSKISSTSYLSAEPKMENNSAESDQQLNNGLDV